MDQFHKESVLVDMGVKMPTHQLKVSYPGGATVATPGCVLTPTQVKDRPSLQWDAEPGAFYTVIMNDPDAPSRADRKLAEFHHWMVGNISGNDVAGGEILADYIGPGPPAKTGLHRYVLLVLKQQKKEDFSGEPHLTNTSTEGRACHKAAAFISKYKLGTPVAGTFIQAEYDDYVPVIHKQIGFTGE